MLYSSVCSMVLIAFIIGVVVFHQIVVCNVVSVPYTDAEIKERVKMGMILLVP